MMRSWITRLKRQIAGYKPQPCVPVGAERVIVVHSHIFKNAGSTIDWALKRNFGDGFMDHRDDAEMRKGPAYLGPYLAEAPHILALSSHHIKPPLPVVAGARLLAAMMFRHPIERVTSVYNFEKRQIPANTPGARFASTHTLGEYVEWRMRFDVPPTIRNFHVYRSLPLPADWRRSVTADELEHAQDFVRSVPLLGVVARFNESMVLFEEVLRQFYPDIDLSYTPQNVGQPPRSLEERIDTLRAEIADDVFRLLCERNAMDMRLYETAQRVFEERLAGIAHLDMRVADFERRCAAR